MNRKTIALFVAALATTTVANAASLTVSPNAGNSGAGVVTTSAFANTANGGTASYRLQTALPADKASIFYTNPAGPGTPLGTLGDLSSLTFDYYVPSTNLTTTNASPAIRFYTNAGGTEGLVWENLYQSPQRGEDAWQNDVQVVGTDLLWQRANGSNYDQIANLNTKAGFQGGFTPPGGDTYSAATLIYGIQISFGSGITGTFEGYVDDVNAVFGGTNPVTYTATSVPEPTTLAALAGAGVLGLRRRRA